MPWAAAITAVGSVAGAVINKSGKGSSTAAQTGTQEVDHTPWAPQGAAIEDGLGQAKDIYAQRTAEGPYTGTLYAGTNGNLQVAQDTAASYARGYGVDAVARANEAGAETFGGLSSAMDASRGVSQQGIGSSNGALTNALSGYGTGSIRTVAQPLSHALHASATAGASSIGGYNAGLNDIMHAGQADPTAQLVGNARTVMNGSATQQMMDNVHRQVGATLNETTVPGLNRMAALGGNLNSSRAGMAEAMANRDAALVEGNADAQIQNNAFNTAYTTSAGQRTAGLNTALGAASAGLSGNSNLALGTGNQDIASAQTAIGAATAGLGQETQHQTADASARLVGAGQLVNSVNAGLAADRSAQALAGGNASLLGTAGQMEQQDAQSKATAAYQKYQIGNTYRQGVLNDYMTNVTKPTGYYQQSGSSSGSAVNTPPSSLGTLIAGGAAAAGSLFAKGGAASEIGSDGGYIGRLLGYGAQNVGAGGNSGSPVENYYNTETGH